MKYILKLFAAPLALALTFLVAVCSFVLSMSGIVFGAVSSIVFIFAVALFITEQTTGGIAWIIIAFLISPFGLPACAGWLIKKLHEAGGALKGFIFS